VLLVIFLLVLGTAVLMPSLQKIRSSAKQEYLRSRDMAEDESLAAMQLEAPPAREDGSAGRTVISQAQVKSFVATIDLTPGLSVGTAQPESIYEAAFSAKLEARNPSAAKGQCEIQLPLPPQLISLSDLTVAVSGDPSEDVFIRDGYLVWRGELDADQAVPIDVTYRAVGKGVYTLNIPPGKIVDTFEATLTANGSDLRLLELSLQPEPPRREAGKTVYVWKYKRLMIGRPIAIDILGIAPVDRLGELVWLGPISVLVFGLLVAMVVLAFRPELLDKWMLLLIVGLFAAAYPLMYFAQEFLSLTMAVVLACVAMVGILSFRAVTLLGPKVGALGVALVAACTLALTMLAATNPRMQGMLLTIEAIGALVLMTILLPHLDLPLTAAAQPAPAPAPAPPASDKPTDTPPKPTD